VVQEASGHIFNCKCHSFPFIFNSFREPKQRVPPKVKKFIFCISLSLREIKTTRFAEKQLLRELLGKRLKELLGKLLREPLYQDHNYD
jgi:hypothetical protein